MMNQRASACLIFGIMHIVSFKVVAQQPKPKDWAAELIDITQTDHIQAASKRIQDVALAPVDVVVLRSTEIKALGYRTLGDALSGIVGFRTNNNHANQFLGSRGLAAMADPNTRILVLLDGHTLNIPSGALFSNVGEDLGLPMELVDRIEVVRGPASCLYGNNAYQALVNVVTIGASGLEQSAFQCATTSGTGGLAELWVRGAVNWQDAKAEVVLSGFQRTGEARVYPQLGSRALSEDLDREERQSGFLRVQGAEWALQGFAMSRTQWVASAPFGSTVGAPSFIRHRRVGGEFRWEPTLGEVHWNFRLYGDRASFDSEALLDATRTGGASGKWLEDNPNYTLGAEVQGRVQLNSEIDLTFGTEQSWNHFNGFSNWENDGLFVKTDVGYNIGNSYAETQWRPGSEWSFVFGLQFATWKARYAESQTSQFAQKFENNDIKRFTPRFSTVWDAGHGQVLKFVYGQGFRLPTLLERYATDYSSFLPNPDLKAEVLDNFQTILSSRWTPRFKTQFVLGYYESKRAIAAVGGGAVQGQYVNSPNTGYGKSLEGESNLTFPNTDLYFGLGWYRLTTNGVNTDNIVPFSGVFKISHRLKLLNIAAEARYSNGRNSRTTATAVPANWTLRLSSRFETDHYWIQVTIDDLTNSRRKDLVGKEFYPVTWMEGDGRSIRGTIGFMF